MRRARQSWCRPRSCRRPPHRSRLQLTRHPRRLHLHLAHHLPACSRRQAGSSAPHCRRKSIGRARKHAAVLRVALACLRVTPASVRSAASAGAFTRVVGVDRSRRGRLGGFGTVYGKGGTAGTLGSLPASNGARPGQRGGFARSTSAGADDARGHPLQAPLEGWRAAALLLSHSEGLKCGWSRFALESGRWCISAGWGWQYLVALVRSRYPAERTTIRRRATRAAVLRVAAGVGQRAASPRRLVVEMSLADTVQSVEVDLRAARATVARATVVRATVVRATVARALTQVRVVATRREGLAPVVSALRAAVQPPRAYTSPMYRRSKLAMSSAVRLSRVSRSRIATTTLEELPLPITSGSVRSSTAETR
jgi:hypothetical protein